MTNEKQKIRERFVRGDHAAAAKVYEELFGRKTSRAAMHYFLKTDNDYVNSDRMLIAYTEAQRRRMESTTLQAEAQ